DVQAVVTGDTPSGILHGLRPGTLVIDMSTISPSATRELAERLAEKGAKMLDAPVSGGSEGAAKGTLSIMIGGDAEDVARARPALEAMGKALTHARGHRARH